MILLKIIIQIMGKKHIRAVALTLKEDLEYRSEFWAPEILWYNLSVYVNEHITPDSSSSKAVKVYSILCDCSEEEMRNRFMANGH